MAALIKRISGSQLVITLASGSLPDALRALVSHPAELEAGKKYTLRVNDYTEVEPILASLRTNGAVIDDMQLQQADLEDVFIQIMGNGQ
jgi:ABC-2 type transport system ATP-binding protein